MAIIDIARQTTTRPAVKQPAPVNATPLNAQPLNTQSENAQPLNTTPAPATIPSTPSVAQKRQELLTTERFRKYDYTGPPLTAEQRKYINPENLAAQRIGSGPGSWGNVFDISDPDKPMPVQFMYGGMVRPAARAILKDGKPIDTSTVFGGYGDYGGRGEGDLVAAHAEFPTQADIEQAGGQVEIVGGTPELRFPTTKEREKQIAAEAEMPAGEPKYPLPEGTVTPSSLKAEQEAHAQFPTASDIGMTKPQIETINRLQQFGNDATGYDLVGYFRKYNTPEDAQALKDIFEDTKTIDRAKLIATEIDENEDLYASIHKGRLTQAQLEDVYGKDEVQKAQRLLMATTPSMAKAGTRTLVTAGEYAQLIKPPDMPDSEYARIAPFIRASGSDWAGAYNAGVCLGTIRKVSGMDDKAIEDMIWYADYQKAPWPKQLAMSYKKDPAGFASEVGKELGIGLIPIAGTEHLAKIGAGVGWVIASGIGDAVMIIPGIGQVSAAVKAGATIPRAVLRASLAIVKGTITAPYQLARHPVASVKALVAPVEMLVSAKRQPLAIFWRGSYAPMSIEKVVAGGTEAEVMATRAAMESVISEVAKGKGAGKVLVGDMGELAYSGTGLQKTMPQTVVTASPYGDVFKGKGIMAEGEGLWTGTAAYEGLESASATGKTPLYVFKDKKVIGLLDDTGKALDDHGKPMGAIAEQSRILDLKGKTLGKWAGGKVIKNGETIAEVKNGAIMADTPQLIGKYYAGQKEIANHKVLGTINKAGEVIGDSGVKVGMASPKVVGFIPEGTKIASDTGITIGSLRSQPVFALITTQGVKQLPEWVMQSKNLAEMETRAWKLFKSGEYGGDLYPVFKQYAKWIENEALLPPGTAIIPVVDGKGNAVILRTRNPAGQVVEVPMMQLARKDWLEASKKLTADLSVTSTTMKPKKTIVETLSDIRDIPKAKKAAPVIAQWFRENPDARLVGSTVEYTYIGKFKPNDLDMGAKDPIAAAKEIAKRVKKATGTDIEVVKNSDGSARLEWVNKGVRTEMANVKGLGDYPTTVLDGVRLETPGAQLTRGLERMESEFGGKGYARFTRFARAMGGEADMGIGAKPPSYAQLREMQARGIWNTVRDIFVKNMSKDKRLALVSKVAPDLEDEARQVIALETRLNAARQGYRASRAAGVTGVRQPMIIARQLAQLNTRYNARATALQQRLEARAMTLSPIAQRVNHMSQVEGERTYNQLVRESPYTERGLTTAERTVARGEVSRAPSRLEAGRVSLRPEVREALRTERQVMPERAERVAARSEISRVPARLEAQTERLTRQQVRAERQAAQERIERAPTRIERLPRQERVPVRGEHIPRIPPRIPPRVPPRIPPRTPPTRVPPPRPPPPPPPKGSTGKPALTHEQISKALSYKHGMGYVIWLYPFENETRDTRFSMKPPKGMKVAKDAKTAAATIQSLYGGKIKKTFVDRRGVVSAVVTSATSTPGEGKIEFISARAGSLDDSPPSLSRSRPRLTVSRPRITPRRPRLR